MDEPSGSTGGDGGDDDGVGGRRKRKRAADCVRQAADEISGDVQTLLSRSGERVCAADTQQMESGGDSEIPAQSVEEKEFEELVKASPR
jgi:hypothetical protein